MLLVHTYGEWGKQMGGGGVEKSRGGVRDQRQQQQGNDHDCLSMHDTSSTRPALGVAHSVACTPATRRDVCLLPTRGSHAKLVCSKQDLFASLSISCGSLWPWLKLCAPTSISTHAHPLSLPLPHRHSIPHTQTCHPPPASRLLLLRRLRRPPVPPPPPTS